MHASNSWYVSPLAGTVLALIGLAVGAAGCMLTVRYARTRRRLGYALLSDSALLASKIGPDDELEVRLRGHDEPIADPHVVVIRLRCQSPVDIRPTDFTGDQPLTIDFGTTIVKPLGVPPPGLRVTVSGDSILIAPGLIRAGSQHTMTVLTDGGARLSHCSELADVRVRDESVDAEVEMDFMGGGLATAAASAMVRAILLVWLGRRRSGGGITT